MQIAALVRDAGSATDIDERGRLLRTELANAGLTALRPLLELALAFHHTVTGEHDQADADLARLAELTADGDHAYYADLARFMNPRHPHDPGPDATTWLDDAELVRGRWRALVAGRRYNRAS
ncbi:hypothetical protein [Streptomyces sp. VRA16 Mangrove soil]|uniref:hypothetical protein n=1 Tax=Streptomyces sp. VRA16 Mangrove soil TaxID=2817434 RepID=UPI001A9D5857|nr:hypothetical protein [Streptomyces sp. VRA16 Mangrove soil]MBO1332572.1 hypothetical protein [Streptomyces sp. VRA16 Mangrove soil]